MKTEKYRVSGMTCAACQANITRCVAKLPGVSDVNVSLLANEMQVTYDEESTGTGAITAAVEGIGYGARSEEAQGAKEDGFRSRWAEREKQAADEKEALRRRLVSSALLLIPLMYAAMGHMAGLPLPAFLTGVSGAPALAFTQLLIAIPVLFINRAFFEKGFKALYKRAPNMDSLVAVGAAAALIYGIFAIYRMLYGLGAGDTELTAHYSHQLYFESSAMILTLVTVGKYLEARSKAKTSDALGRLVELAPATARVLRDGAELEIPASELSAGELVVVRPGEAIPADGTVEQGRGFVDQAAVTGESLPVEKNPGDRVICATVNRNGSFRFRASEVGDDTTLARIIRLVDEAGSSKAPIARLADKVSGVFVPTVIAIALVTAAAWLLGGESFEFALSRAISVLVISCPCALGLATPVAIMAGTGKAAEYGILVKSATALETLRSVEVVALDKTGTVTRGEPSVTDVLVLDKELDERSFMAEAAAVETGSEHPLAQAVVKHAASMKLKVPAASDFVSVTGRGVKAEVNGRQYLAGNPAFLRENGQELPEAFAAAERFAASGKTPLIFAADGRAAGVIAVADTVKEESAAAIAGFRKMGLRVAMLTGDNALTAAAIGEELGIDEVIADVLPDGKEARIRALQEGGRRVAMVGDGINDAPALTRADVGVAIGAGTDIAIDSADVVLMRDSLMDAVTAVKLSRAVIRNVKENLFWAFFYNVLGIPVAAGLLYPAFGITLSPMLGAAAMSLSSVCVVTNALRLRRFRDPDNKRDEKKTPPEIPAEKGVSDMKITLNVEGMMCAHCKANVEKALLAVPGVTAAEADLAAKTAAVTASGEVSSEALCAAVTAAGYECSIG